MASRPGCSRPLFIISRTTAAGRACHRAAHRQQIHPPDPAVYTGAGKTASSCTGTARKANKKDEYRKPSAHSSQRTQINLRQWLRNSLCPLCLNAFRSGPHHVIHIPSPPKPDARHHRHRRLSAKAIDSSGRGLQYCRLCLMDTLGCGFRSAVLSGVHKADGAGRTRCDHGQRRKVPGTSFQLDPVMAAFNIGCMSRWLDFNDTWLAAEWGHPSTISRILAMARLAVAQRRGCRKKPLRCATC